jgi:salicylate hydroxylase/6-hydroxynicotinate 3-monooxygenase
VSAEDLGGADVHARKSGVAAVEGDDVEGAFRRYEAHRKPRTSVIQAISSANSWMQGGDADTAWLYGYDAWNADLDRPADRPRAKAA